MKNSVLILLSLFYFQLHAEVAVFKHYGVTHGLPNTRINAIIEDKNGLIWIGTETALLSFDGKSFTEYDSPEISIEQSIQSLYVLNNNDVLVGTRDNGLLIYKHNKLTQLSHDDLNQQMINGMAEGADGNIWVAATNGIFKLSKNLTIKRVEDEVINSLQNQKINSITKLDEQYIVFGQKNILHIYDTINKTMDHIRLDDDVYIHDVYKDHTKVLWIGTSKRLYRYDLITKKSLQTPELKQASRILSIKPHQDDIWIASIDGGLYRINILTLENQQFSHNKAFSFSLSDKSIMTLHISHDGTLWAGDFYGGLNTINLNLMSFNFETNKESSIHCAPGPRIFSIETDQDNGLWIGNNYGLVHWNPANNNCDLIDHNTKAQTPPFSVYDTSIDQAVVWLASSIGLLSYDKQSQQITWHNKNLPQSATLLVQQLGNDQILVGTNQGLYQYDRVHSTSHKIELPEKKFQQISYSQYFFDKNRRLFLATNHGLLFLDSENKLQEFSAHNNFFIDKKISAVATNDKGELFISVKELGLYHLDDTHQLVQHYFEEIKYHNIKQILSSGNTLWMSSNHGIITLDTALKKVQLYASETNENFLALYKWSHKDHLGKLYFGGKSGMIHFDPQDIDDDFHVYPLILDKLYLMDSPVALNNKTQTGFTLSKPINQVKNLTFSHRDKMIGFSFIQPNYNNPKAIEYRYKLSPISSKWTSLNGRDPRLTFTNLKSGRYQLDIEATSFNLKSHKSINFVVKSPPWLSWWAFTIYALLLMAAIYFYIKRRVANEKKINTYLKKQVQQQTNDITQQKNIVEDLMARKNEIFSNVSHEFRTPITLILGPMEELQKAEKDQTKKQSFDVVTRNARRLLDLVNQMLKLAQISETDTSQQQLIELSSRLNMIIEPFVYLAKLNRVNLIISPLVNTKLLLTEDALETIMGNLISNAIKYTEAGGEVIIGSRLHESHVEVFVKDNGQGIAKNDQNKIFKRFERLSHGSAQGVGIGLALVKELVDLNQGELILNSDSAQGAEFIVKLPIDLSLQNHDISRTSVVIDQANHIEPSILTSKQTVLVIEDNKDMRIYIEQVLATHFNCILAAGGTDGIAKALKHVPDIVICDVMMPVIDGFQVCRQLRSEMITSHIPLVLLTAVNEKASRIKGWRENIDRYLHKPFDAQELILQLKNILNTRQLLITKHLKDSSTEKLPYFSETDQSFLDKLNRIIAEGYTDPLFNLEKMASLMMVSDRQLQRKVKALVDRTPIELVREFRLKNAAQLLAKGKQIAYISDICGFSNASHFSYSFKKSYGMTPKAYQKLKHKA